tara:strand:- start:21322 stop:22167 length:846 start_codon:yes stop_codon:yes gene_type:complete
MTKDIISLKTRTEFQDHFAGWSTLAKISDIFDSAHIDCDSSFIPNTTGQRRSLVRQYEHSLDLTKPKDARKLLDVYELIMIELSWLEADEYQGVSARKELERLRAWIKRDGFDFADGRVVAIDGHNMLDGLGKVSEPFDSPHLRKQIRRMQDSVEQDPWLAIGTAKELVETTCKTILEELGVEIPKKAEIKDLVKLVREELKLTPDDILEAAKASSTIKKMLSNLGTIAQGLAELRNPYGTGHGPTGNAKGLSPRHARLAIGSAAVLATFLLETYEERGTR